MDRPSKTFSSAGFYLILLFSFFISIFPAFAHVLAVLAFLLWIIEQAIFRNSDWLHDEVFFPFAGFILLTFVSFLVSGKDGENSILPYTGYIAVFYFVVQRFVPLSEKRKMVIWTFIIGVILSCSINIIMKFSAAGIKIPIRNQSADMISFSVLTALAMVLAFYIEGNNIKEKLFFTFLSLPLAFIAILSFNTTIVIMLLFLIFLVGIFVDRAVILPLGIYMIFIYSGIFETAGNINPSQMINFLQSSLTEFTGNADMIKHISFFGLPANAQILAYNNPLKSYFLKLIVGCGPFALSLFLWILIEQLRRNLVKFRKITFREMKAFHLGAVITIISFFFLNLTGDVFETNSAVLICWMILGMSEI